MRNFYLILFSLLLLTGCSKKITYSSDGIGRDVTVNSASGYSKITIQQSVDASHYFTEKEIIKTEIWLGDKKTPFIFSLGSVLKEVDEKDRSSSLADEYDKAYKQSTILRQKLINGGMIVVGDDNSISNEENWIKLNKTKDLSTDLTN